MFNDPVLSAAIYRTDVILVRLKGECRRLRGFDQRVVEGLIGIAERERDAVCLGSGDLMEAEARASFDRLKASLRSLQDFLVQRQRAHPPD